MTRSFINDKNLINDKKQSFYNPIKNILTSLKECPKDIAIVYDNKEITWQQYYNNILRIADTLKNDYKIEKGDKIAVLTRNNPEMMYFHFAIPLIGAIIVPLNYMEHHTNLSYIIENSDSKIIIWDSYFDEKIEMIYNLPNNKIRIDTGSNNYPDFKVDDYNQIFNSRDKKNKELKWDDLYMEPTINDIISLNYTSGTTAHPKGVLLKYHLFNTYDYVTINDKIKFLPCVPMFHLNCWGQIWNIALLKGITYLIDLSNKNLYSFIVDNKINYIIGSPIILERFINSIKKSLEYELQFLTGGAPPKQQIFNVAIKNNINITHGYGLTETGMILKNKNSIIQGYPWIGCEIRIVNIKDNKDVKKNGDEYGEIWVKSDNIYDYYKSVNHRENGYFRTGDIAVQYPDGAIQIVDRKKDMIISGGENISSLEVENCLNKFPGIKRSAVIAKPDDKWGEVPFAFLELGDNCKNNFSEEEINKFCKKYLPSFKIPKNFKLIKNIPTNPTGKILKKHLRNLIIS